MTFKKEDLKRIAKNMKAIRLAYGYKTQLDFAMALDRNGRRLGLSYDMIKKYESGSYPIQEQAVRYFCHLTMFRFEQLVFEDLSFLEPNSLVLNDVGVEDFSDNQETIDYIADTINTIFPLFRSKKAMKSKEFSKAYAICVSKLSSINFKEEDLFEALSLFGQTNFVESFVNPMSLLGRLYVYYIYYGVKQEIFDTFAKDKFNNMLDFNTRIYRKRFYEDNAQFILEAKRKFMEAYNSNLTLCMDVATRDPKYSDYAYYYLAVRYYYGMMDNDITRLSDDEMNSFGISLMDCLTKMNNKYAMEFSRIMKDF